MKAYNEQTGETLELVDGEWVPERAPQQAPADPDVPTATPENFTGGAPVDEGISLNPLNKEFLGVTWPGESGALSMLGAINPAFGGTTGVAAGVQGLSAAAGRSAPVAAAMTRTADMAGSAVNAVVDPIVKAATYATELVKNSPPVDMTMSLAQHLPVFGAAAGRQSSRIKSEKLLQLAQQGGRAQSAGAMAATPLRVHPTLATSDELAAQLGMDVGSLTPTQRAMLDQTQGTYDELADPISNALRGESEAVFAGNAGEDVKGAWDTVQRQFARKITDDAGLNSRQGITLSAVSERRKEVGSQIGQMLDEKFPSSVVPLNPDYSLKLAVKGGSAGDESKEAAKILEKWGLLQDGEDVLDAPLRNVQSAKRELDALSEVANKPGVTQNADEIIRRLDNNLIDGLEEIDRNYYSKLKYQYRILSKLREPGVVDDFGKINPKSFNKQWLKGESPNSRHLNEFARLADTVNLITPRSTAGTTGARTLAGDLAPEAGAAVGRLIGL